MYVYSGKYVKLATMMRAKTRVDHLECEIASMARRNGISSLIAPSQSEDIPKVEWWDAAIIPNKRLFVCAYICVCMGGDTRFHLSYPIDQSDVSVYDLGVTQMYNAYTL